MCVRPPLRDKCKSHRRSASQVILLHLLLPRTRKNLQKFSLLMFSCLNGDFKHEKVVISKFVKKVGTKFLERRGNDQLSFYISM